MYNYTPSTITSREQQTLHSNTFGGHRALEMSKQTK